MSLARNHRALIAMVTLASLGLCGRAAAVPYADGLILTVGDKTFSFGGPSGNCGITAIGGASLTDCSQLDIEPLIVGSGAGALYGFAITGNISATGAGSVNDVSLFYHVHVNDPNYKISDAHLAVSATAQGVQDIDYVAAVNEDLMDGATPEGTLAADDIDNTDSANTTDFLTDLDVSKDILVAALTSTGSASVTEIDQLFSQIYVGVPEPGTLVILGSCLLGLVRLRRPVR